MKQRLQPYNRLLFVLCHLLLFIYPTISRLGHAHEPKHHEVCSHCTNSSVSVSEQEEHCPICAYEFFNFINEADFQPSVFRQAYPVLVSPVPNPVYTRLIRHASLRAPPTA
ncbi:MAG: hypothetical protein ACK5JD_05635 [Mangrovibacterium sp.]